VKKQLQNATRNNSKALITIKEGLPDTISVWIEAYFRFEATTSQSSRKVQKRNLELFRDFMIDDCGREDRSLWTPRLSKAFADHLKKKEPTKGRGGYSDRTVNRILAHLKTLAKWIH
jgi:lysophospholipase L1-like esterase